MKLQLKCDLTVKGLCHRVGVTAFAKPEIDVRGINERS